MKQQQQPEDKLFTYGYDLGFNLAKNSPEMWQAFSSAKADYYASSYLYGMLSGGKYFENLYAESVIAQEPNELSITH